MTYLQFLASCLFIVSGMTLADEPPGPAQVLDEFHQAAARADQQAYLALLSEQMVFLGTDGSERWEGQAFRDFVNRNFSTGRGWRYSPQGRNIAVSDDGNTVWFDESLLNETLGPCRGSGVMLKTAAGWKIAQYNLSVPVPNMLVEQVVADIAAFEQGVDAPAAQEAGQAGSADVSDSDPEGTASPGKCKRKRHKTNRKAGC